MLSPSPHDLTDELKKLVGWGAQPKHLATKPLLRELAGVSDSASYTATGFIIRKYIEESIGSLQGQYQFDGLPVEAERLRIALRQILGIGSGRVMPLAPERRYKVIVLLKVGTSVEEWRRPFGQERELLSILASAMLDSVEEEKAS